MNREQTIDEYLADVSKAAKEERLLTEAMSKVRHERKRQDERFPRDIFLKPDEWLPILLEEVTELTAAVATEDYDGQHGVEAELVQVAAVAVAWLEDIERSYHGTKSRTKPD